MATFKFEKNGKNYEINVENNYASFYEIGVVDIYGFKQETKRNVGQIFGDEANDMNFIIDYLNRL